MADAFKNEFFNTEFIKELSIAIADNYIQFDRNGFFLAVLDDNWEYLELKQRMRHISQRIHEFLSMNYEEAIDILIKVVEQTQGFGNMIFPDFVEVYGLENWEISIKALEKFTQFGSSEFAIRPFIIADKQRAMQQMTEWSLHDNHHVRRLSSEGCRPRLPWAMALPEFKKDPSLIIPILENLKDDKSDYVRKSVANNLNDISKDHSELVLSIGKKWLGKSKHRDRIIKHGLRTLLKAGNTEALLLFGFANPEHIDVEIIEVSPEQLSIGEEITFKFNVINKSGKVEKLRLEYRVFYIKKNSKASPKIFQISEKEFIPGETTMQKKHSFRERSTRKHYIGVHKVEIIVNGEVKSEFSVDLLADG